MISNSLTAVVCWGFNQGLQEAQPRASGQIGEHPPVPLDGHTLFLIAINERITSELLARNHLRISVPMAHVACMHVTEKLFISHLVCFMSITMISG
jgi:hypothetical protein